MGLKHGRISMLASLGIVVSEKFHPLYGGNIDVPAAFTFQETSLEKFWLAAFVAISIPEILSLGIIQFGAEGGDTELKLDRTPGDYGWDPLGLGGPNRKVEFKKLQDRELNNGRLAMFAVLGMLAQEVVEGKKLF